MRGITVNGTVLAATQFRDFYVIVTMLPPPNLQKQSDRCMQTFLVRHVMSCPNGGLVITRHNEICEKIIHFAKQYLFPNCVRGKTLIHKGHRISEKEVRQRGSAPETCDDVYIRELSEIQTEEMIDVKFRDDDAHFWNTVIMDKLLSGWKKINKKNHGQACYDQRRYFLCFYYQLMGR